MAAPYTVNSGNLATITTDFVGIAIAGSDYATARFSASIAGTATVTAQVSVDGGVNYIPAPYAKKVSAASGNPTVQAISATTLVAADVWEVPLPANCTNFRLLCAGSGTAVTVSVAGGAPYVQGAPVVAVLYDVTSGSNAALDTGTLDVSGWATLAHLFTMSGGTPAFSTQLVDDAGTSSASIATWAVASLGGVGVGTNLGQGATAGLAAVGTNAPLPKRIRYQSAAIVAQTSRIRLEARR